MAKSYGKTWWGQQWLNALNNIDFGNRLPRGSSYANKGAVTKIAFEGNRISAKVQGSRRTPYDVDIVVPPFFDKELKPFLKELTARPALIAQMMNRELSPEVLPLAEANGLKVFPQQWTDFKMHCSCPDWAVPCKHLAAVIYKVSAEIDNDPFLVFSLHRVDLVDELGKLGVTLARETHDVPMLRDLCIGTEKGKKPAKRDYDPEAAYRKLSFAGLSPIHGPLMELLTEKPAFYQGSGDFKEKYAKNLNRAVRDMQRVLSGKSDMALLFGKATKSKAKVDRHSRNRVVVDDKLQPRVHINDEDFPLTDFLRQVMEVPASRTLDYQPSTAVLHTVFNLALHLLANGAVVPQPVQWPDGTCSVRWLPALISSEVRDLVDSLDTMLPPGIFVWKEKKAEHEVDRDTAANLLSLFVTELMGTLLKDHGSDLFLELFFLKKRHPFNGPGEIALRGGMAAWTAKYFMAQGTHRPQIVVSEGGGEIFKVEMNILSGKGKLEAPIRLSEVLSLKKYEKERFAILQSVTRLHSFIPSLEHYVNSGAAKPIAMDMESFAPFLMRMIPAIRLMDIEILLPKSLQQILKPRPSVKIAKKAGAKTFIRLDQLLDFNWQVAIGDEMVDEREFRELMRRSDGLLNYKGRYIYVEKGELEKLHRHFTTAKELSPFEMLRTALSGSYMGAPVALTDEVRELIKKLSEPGDIPLPAGLRATLRPYQVRGYSWMVRNAQVGFGSVIADDMGLGKTLQVISTLLKFKQEGFLKDKKALVVAPTGLLTNWQAEMEKFAPSLRVSLYHGSARKDEGGYDVLLTSYGIARSDAAKLKKMPWHALVIDEAQNIKNLGTEQTKAVRSIPADNFIAMSGTPVENRLSELWSIMDYSNRGLLGSPKEFAEEYANAIETLNDKDVAEKLRKVTAPFMMRRLKTDRSIISDLPDKIEMDRFGSLVKEQASLYEKTVEEAMREIEGVDASNSKGLFVRQGLVLQMIMALKQICNHPAQFLKNNAKDPALSGKAALLFETLDTIMESHEKVLIFSQFTEMGTLLKGFIKERYGHEPLFYHGGCTLKQRKEMVERFQTDHAHRIFLLSLKAAGTGLNLTAANHVIHYDLWWNPAVEAQATDRAYRIGQKSNVMVHRFITRNTFEERINEMIQAKKALAEMTVSTGENWIGNLSNKELKELFELR